MRSRGDFACLTHAVEFELVVLLEVELRWTCQLDHDDGLLSVGIYDDVRPLQSRDYMGRKNQPLTDVTQQLPVVRTEEQTLLPPWRTPLPTYDCSSRNKPNRPILRTLNPWAVLHKTHQVMTNNLEDIIVTICVPPLS